MTRAESKRGEKESVEGGDGIVFQFKKMTSDDNIIFLKGREIRLARGQTFTNESRLKESDDIQGWHNKCVCLL